MSEDVAPQETAAAPTTTKKPRSKPVPNSLKAEATAMWRTGDYTVKEIVAKLGQSEDYWRTLFNRKRVLKGEKAKEFEAKREQAIETALAIDPAVHARRVFDTKNETYRILEMLRKLVAKTIVEATQAGKTLGSTANDMKAIREAAAAIKITREEAYAVLGISVDDIGDDQLPELRIEDLTEEQIESLQLAEGELESMPGLPDLPGEDEEVVEG